MLQQVKKIICPIDFSSPSYVRPILRCCPGVEQRSAILTGCTLRDLPR